MTESDFTFSSSYSGRGGSGGKTGLLGAVSGVSTVKGGVGVDAAGAVAGTLG